jgi:hypothetical protein
MPEQMAAAYLGLSVSRFQAVVAPEVEPITVSQRVRIWVREDLDEWLDRKRGRVPGSAGYNPWD